MAIPVQDFRQRMEDKQSVYKTEILGIKQMGRWRDGHHPHVLPEDSWSLNLWQDISYEAIKEFAQHGILWSAQKQNMLSSQIMCVNVFFPLKQHTEIIKSWLSRRFDVMSVIGLEFEYIGAEDYFNEDAGRNQDRTRSDLAIVWEDKEKRKSMLLLEYTFTERNFGECSQETNPEPRRCHSSKMVVHSPRTQCFKAREGRAYWKYALSSNSPFLKDRLRAVPYCPFRYDFYNLMRRQLLAHCIEMDPRAGIHRVHFGIMYHADNDVLQRLPHSFAGEGNSLKAWVGMLKNPDTFHTFTVQDFMQAAERDMPHQLEGWRSYLKQRYGV